MARTFKFKIGATVIHRHAGKLRWVVVGHVEEPSLKPYRLKGPDGQVGFACEDQLTLAEGNR